MLSKIRSIRTKLFLGVGVAAALAVVALAIAVTSMQHINRQFGDFVENDLATLQAYKEMYAQGLQAGQAIRNVVLDPANQKAYANMDKAQAAFDAAFNSASTLQKDNPAATQVLGEIKDIWQKNSEAKEKIKTLAPSNQAEAISQLNKEETPTWREVRARLLSELEKQQGAVKDTRLKMQQEAGRSILASLILGAAALLIGGLFMVVVVGSILRSVCSLRASMEELAKGKGDLTTRLRVETNDEVGRTSEAFNEFMAGLQNLIRGVRGNAEEVANASTELSAAAAQVAEGSQHQSEAASSTASAVEEITVSIASVSDAAEEVRQLSSASLQQTRKGNGSLAELVGEIGRVETAVKQITSQVEEFVRSTNAITGMTKQVKDLAEQTNLLALNAAIEAARAGEQGRGFAVVADEVRKLAERSGQSASEIDAVTQSLQSQSGEVERSIQNGLQSLAASQAFLGTVRDVLGEAGQSVVQANQGVDDIAASVKEQKVASNDIAKHVERIAQMAEENSAAIVETSSAAHRLEQLAAALQEAVGRFKA